MHDAAAQAGHGPHPAALRALCAAASRGGNPSSVHGLGRAARRDVGAAAAAVLELVRRPDGQVIFVGSAREGHLLVLLGGAGGGLALGAALREPGLIAALAAAGLPWHAGGPDHVATRAPSAARPAGWRHALVVAAAAAAARPPLAIDASADSLLLPGRVVGGPPGVAALVLPAGATLTPLHGGGPQGNGMRPGTEAVPLICGLGAACHAMVAP